MSALKMFVPADGVAAIKQFVPVADNDYEPIRHMARIANQTESWLSTGRTPAASLDLHRQESVEERAVPSQRQA